MGKRSVAARFFFCFFFAFVATVCVFKGLVCPIIEMLPMLMRYMEQTVEGRKEGRNDMKAVKTGLPFLLGYK